MGAVVACPPPLQKFLWVPMYLTFYHFYHYILFYISFVFRNHLNDLENIPAFIMTAILYTMTGPAPQMALWHFRIFAASRITHMIVFQLAGPQPIRGSMFMTGVLCTMSMLVQSICAVC